MFEKLLIASTIITNIPAGLFLIAVALSGQRDYKLMSKRFFIDLAIGLLGCALMLNAVFSAVSAKLF